MEPVGLLVERYSPEGVDVERVGDDLPEPLVCTEGEEPLRLVRVIRPYALVVLSSVDAEVEEAARFESGPDPAQGGRKLAVGHVKQAVERVDRIESTGWEIQVREVHHARREALALAQRDHLG